MKLVIFSFIALCCATCINAGNAPMVYISLNGMEKSFLTFVSTMGPVFNQTYNNVMSKVTEFEFLEGVQPIFILSTLYAQFLPAYTICKQQLLEQISGFPALIVQNPTPAGEYVEFTSNQLNQFSNAQTAFANADGVAIAGLLAQINAIGTLANSDDFTYTHKTFTAPTADMQAFISSLSGFLQGNQDLVKGLKLIKSLNVNTVAAQQNYAYSTYFVQGMFNYFDSALTAYGNICSAIQTSIDGINSLVDSSAASTTLNTKAVVLNIVTGATQLANDFFTVSSIDMEFASQIAHPPPMSASSTTTAK